MIRLTSRHMLVQLTAQQLGGLRWLSEHYCLLQVDWVDGAAFLGLRMQTIQCRLSCQLVPHGTGRRRSEIFVQQQYTAAVWLSAAGFLPVALGVAWSNSNLKNCLVMRKSLANDCVWRPSPLNYLEAGTESIASMSNLRSCSNS